MNTRLQVEHPVTEAVTGLDLVEWQLRIASGEPLPLAQDQIGLAGYAMEARLYAENPERGFLPSVGALTRLRLPASVRVDSAVEEGDEVSAYYDPMIAKLIAHGPTRADAARRLAGAAAEVQVWPVTTNAAFLVRCLRHPDFLSGAIDTGFIAERLDDLIAPPTFAPAEAVGALAAAPRGASLWAPGQGPAGFRLNAGRHGLAHVRLNSEPAELAYSFGQTAAPLVRLGEGDVVAFHDGAALRLGLEEHEARGAGEAGFDGAVRTPMPGRIVRVAVAQGDRVDAGAALVVLEAMKMEHTLSTPVMGTVAHVAVREGDQVIEGLIAVRIAADAA
jgi:acetyl/propionyl-CoA carboxylase alpha subunit